MDRTLLCLALLGAALAAAAEAPSATRVRAILKPSHEIEVASPVGGVIERILVKEGDSVAKGQPLVELDSKVQEAVVAISEQRAKSTARIESAQANLDVKRVAHQRQKNLHAKGVASDVVVEEAALELKHAESLLTVAKEEQALYRLEVARDRAVLARLTVRAPLAGIVMRRLRDAGEATDEFQPLLQLVVLDVLHVMAHVPHDVAARLKPGHTARLVLDDRPKERHVCRVLMIDPVIDAASGTCRVKLELPNPKREVAAGSRATLVLAPPERRAQDAR